MHRSIVPLFFLLLIPACAPAPAPTEKEVLIPHPADVYLDQVPVPITAAVSERSAGGPRDFYSEGDYWWPDPENPDGPYIRRDGETNPDNFVAHRRAMVALAKAVAALTAAYVETNDDRYADKAMEYLQVWFVNPQTSMTPHLLYAQAIKGRVTGRGIGIIDTIHLIEVAKAIQVLRDKGYLKDPLFSPIREWFGEYLTWLITHPYGIDERDHGNNHSTWWAAQVAAFADLTDRPTEMELAQERFKTLLSAQMNDAGGFVDELKRTKPYIYMLFILEGYSVLAEYATTPDEDLWNYEGAQGSLRKAWNFMLPFIKDKSTWTYPPDVMHFDKVPIQSPGLFLAARAYDDEEMMAIWESLDPERANAEIERNFPIRQPILWQ
ncbi:MAG: alginate lyase family protein [Bacteroidota bacterium]